MAEDSGEVKSNVHNKYEVPNTGIVWKNKVEVQNEEPRRSRLKEFVGKLLPPIQKHNRKRRSLIRGAIAGTLLGALGGFGVYRGSETAEANLDPDQEIKSENRVTEREIPKPPAPEPTAPKERFPSKDSRNQFEQYTFANAPIERQAEIGKLMMAQVEAYKSQVGVERQLDNTLRYGQLIENVLKECGYPDSQIEKRKITMLAQIFVESGGNQYAEQGDPECKNPKPRTIRDMGQGLFQVNLIAADDVIEQFKFKLTNIKNPEQNTNLAVLYTKKMESIFVDELISINAYHTGQGNMRFGIEYFLQNKLGIDPKELEKADWMDLKKYLTVSYPQIGNRRISIFDIFMDPETRKAMDAHGKSNDSTISFDYTFKLLAAARLLFDKSQAKV